jgi:hypothetical protein
MYSKFTGEDALAVLVGHSLSRGRRASGTPDR